MTNIMLDLETLGHNPTSVIIEIGACVFSSKEGVTDRFSEKINIESNVAIGRTMDASTIQWWMMQKWDARKLFKGLDDAPDLESVLMRFEMWIPEKAMVWGNGSDFDNVILKDAYRTIGRPVPWPERNDRCFRTMKNMFPRVRPPEFVGVKHCAVDDAVHQANWLLKIYKESMKG